MKLNINKLYSVFTTSNYIENKQVKILGYINYERASQYNSMVENVAINEKFINNVGDGDTLEYLKNQIYYDCAVVENKNGEWVITDEHLILWDDIIDFDKTEIINESHVYKMEFKIKNLSNTDTFNKDDIIKTIKNAIDKAYNIEKEKVAIEFTEIYDNSLDSVGSQLEKSRAIIDKANDSLLSMISLETSAKQINSQFSDNNILGKVNDMSTKLNDMDKALTSVISRLK